MFPKRIIYKTDSGSEEDLRIYTVACIIWYNIIYLRKIYKDNSNKRRTYLQRISHTKYKNKLVNLHQRPTKRWQVKVNKKKLSPFPVFFPLNTNLTSTLEDFQINVAWTMHAWCMGLQIGTYLRRSWVSCLQEVVQVSTNQHNHAV